MTDEPVRNSDHGGLADAADELQARIAAATDLIDAPEGAPVVELRRRARRRVRRRRSVRAVGAAAAVALAAVAAVQLVRPTEQEVFVAEPPVIEDRPLGTSPDGMGEWTWRDVDTMTSRTGSPAGYGTRKVVGDDLLIYLTDEGVCLDAASCADARADFGADELRREFVDDDGGPAAGLIGDGAPFGDWNVVVVPGVTGDLFVGGRSDVDVPGGPSGQRFEGAANLQVVLKQLAQQRPPPKRVVLVGSGTSGLGALMATPAVEQLAGDRLVAVIADGGAVPSQQMPPTCVVRGWSELWDTGYPEDWTDHVPDPSARRLNDLYPYLAGRYPGVTFAQLSGTDDPAMRSLYGTAADRCDPSPRPVTAPRFAKAISALEARLRSLDGWELFLLDESTSAPLATSSPAAGGDALTDFARWADAVAGP